MDLLSHKIRLLKNEVKVWTKAKVVSLESVSLKLDKEIRDLLSNTSSGILTLEEQHTLNNLRLKKKKVLDHHLLTWHLKSRVNWALFGDSNTKLFHALASGRRNQNAIWSLEDNDGNCIDEEEALKNLGLNHFSHVFRDDNQTCLFTQLKVVMLFPTMIPS